jgi:DNA-binding IclR family transcriptional regulator
MEEQTPQTDLTSEERRIIELLRQGPQSVEGLIGALEVSPDHLHRVLQSLDRKVGIVSLFRSGSLRYGLAE